MPRLDSHRNILVVQLGNRIALKPCNHLAKLMKPKFNGSARTVATTEARILSSSPDNRRHPACEAGGQIRIQNLKTQASSRSGKTRINTVQSV
jgi:hypothetical protein